MDAVKNDTKQVFKKKGTCSQTFFYLLNRQFGYQKENEERASDPLAGGLMQTGNQCGMLWGSSLAVGSESFRKYGSSGEAISKAVTATQSIMKSFAARTKSVNCRDVTGCDFSRPFGLIKYMIKIFSTGIMNSVCFNLAGQWAAEALHAANESLSNDQINSSEQITSCACETAKKMGANDEETISVAGFAGGLGLSGNACGALAAALWMKTLSWCKVNPGKNPPYFTNTVTKRMMETFYRETNSEILCNKICGRNFNSIEEHSQFIQNGGCAKLIDVLGKL